MTATTQARRIAELDAELNEMILDGKALEAFEQFYADDCVMIEHGMEPFIGKDFNREREKDFFAKVTEFRGARLKQAAVTDDVSFSTWHYDYSHADWGDVKYDQVAVRKWRDGLIAEERFYRG